MALVPELSVRDLTATRHFYCALLGFSVRYERVEEGFAYLEMGSAELMLDQIGVGRDWTTGLLVAPFGRGINLQIEVDAIDPILKRLEAASITLFQLPETRRYQTGELIVVQRQFCVQDPDGYLLRFFERL